MPDKDKDKVDGYYQRQAKDVVNMMYDKGFIAEDVSRESMQSLEDLLGYLIQTQAETAVRCAEVAKKARNAN